MEFLLCVLDLENTEYTQFQFHVYITLKDNVKINFDMQSYIASR